jgi:ribosomal protein L7/L12
MAASGLLFFLGAFLLIAVVGGMVVVFVLNRSWGGSLDRGSSPPPPDRRPDLLNLTGDVEADARALLRSRGKIDAIKRVRELTGLGLKEAKDYVEALERGEAPPPPQSTDPLGEPLAPAEMAYAARVLISQGDKIAAIKLVREQTGWGLKEAKDYVERL